MSDPGSDLERRVTAFVDLRSKAPGVAVEARSDLAGPIKELDGAYWQAVSQLISESVKLSGESLAFSPEQRLLLDFGFLDPRLLDGDAETFRAAAIAEMAEAAPPEYCYFSEWLLERLKTYLSLARPTLPVNSPGPRIEAPPLCKKFNEARVRIYNTLLPFLKDLPGVPPQVVDSLVSGRIDATIQDLTLMGGHASPPLLEKMTRLRTVRDEIIQKAKGRCTSDQQFVIFDALGQVDEKIDDEIAKVIPTMMATNLSGDARLGAASWEERVKVLVDEANLVKALLRLGTMGVGITRTHSVLLTDQARMTKTQLTSIMSTVRELDPHLPVIPQFMIAPFCGTGLYAWDKDTIIVPLVSMKENEESVVNALASCRIMVDTMNSKGRLRDLYETTFPGTEFRRDFVRDYRNWILGVGKGFRGAMETPQYEFFKVNVGPSADDLFAPAGMVRLTPNERTEIVKYCRRRINRGESTFQDYYRLAVLYWREGRYHDALDLMTIAVRQSPSDGRAVLAVGVMHKKMRHVEQAKLAFTDVAQIARNTLWHVYANEQLANL